MSDDDLLEHFEVHWLGPLPHVVCRECGAMVGAGAWRVHIDWHARS